MIDLSNFHSAVSAAKEDVRKGDVAIAQLLGLACGRLRVCSVPTCVLVNLKRELSGFNSKTRKWNDA